MDDLVERVDSTDVDEIEDSRGTEDVIYTLGAPTVSVWFSLCSVDAGVDIG
jgi:hypothetical protein